jgi:hypothetical protein
MRSREEKLRDDYNPSELEIEEFPYKKEQIKKWEKYFGFKIEDGMVKNNLEFIEVKKEDNIKVKKKDIVKLFEKRTGYNANHKINVDNWINSKHSLTDDEDILDIFKQIHYLFGSLEYDFKILEDE